MYAVTFAFRIFPKEGFMEKVKEYAEADSIEDVTEEDITWFVRDNILPATSNSNVFEVEGGDTDGWFVDHLDQIDYD